MAREITFTRLGGKVPFADGGLRLSKSILIDRIEPHGDFRSLFRIGDDLLERITNSIRENSFDASQPLHIWAKAEDDGIVHNYLIDGYTRRGTPGLIQSPIPSTTAIDTRCSQIQNFNSEKYYEFYGSFGKLHAAATCKGIYLSPENKTQFARDDLGSELKAGLQKEAKAIENKTEKKETPAPRLHNLNAVQKDAFRLYGLPAEETLSIIQKLYEEYKCVSYPPPPSKVMGSGNAGLVRDIFTELAETHPSLNDALKISDISPDNKRCFNDAKLEAHHALIPLKNLPAHASEAET